MFWIGIINIMIKNKNNGVTLDELASMVARGFENTATKRDVSDVNLRIDNLDKKVDKLDYQVSEAYDILKRFEESDILNLQKRVQILEKAVRSLASQLQK
ncbi:MAG: hypothetical protein A3B91_01390 [Candidatus Yanofskybacteria bacterium RIFCSPHIGHO2_02_FULL_41_29]|uniref:Uncharacterized protein n=1 Tax=Candidatus Yanofskybacteria bacterium RIFCSPHIGHO2_01_FULL_41_53 TaxID=1802663 RepID=A0A1F8EKC8_9BACT|nr:MAG: hypothetical protein A2650_04675 [Candidatus Yanofskybacteria bacterium RIFCSPHIGHO2_01_FULL_41_53]OGN12430.1 MAG: hypothetical protein A3B91_01390 [Candidatus Yanofskybacteria bacterium RIFCSPHIGHO2_02_FULL_41_29]OGN18676.1 MAG: hypothetical protein A3F48_02520 [Candidatus Yanofskybacteria bacterium RIFCSPHIGHO2_12_FULL_41_9]OGN24409.1 MAG: hypothetical protein A2916_04205 [Candidatus Yanofskybacteria bacterium RIFCSPLOWO2_01_FULL_41_67]OGN28642.1 MAG: hypothetical protein A3H54_01040 